MIFYLWNSMKQFEECVKLYISYTLRTLFGFLQRPLFSVNIGQCPVSSLLISWAGFAFGFFFLFTSLSDCTCDKLGLPLFLISVFRWRHKHAAISALNCRRFNCSFWFIFDSSQSFLYKSQEFTTATFKKWRKMLEVSPLGPRPPWTCYISWLHSDTELE